MKNENFGVTLQRQKEGLKEMLAYNCLFNKMNDKLNGNNDQFQQQAFVNFASPIDK